MQGTPGHLQGVCCNVRTYSDARKIVMMGRQADRQARYVFWRFRCLETDTKNRLGLL